MNPYTPNLYSRLRSTVFFAAVRSGSCLFGAAAILRKPELSGGQSEITTRITLSNNSCELSHNGRSVISNLASRLGFSRKLHASVSAGENFNLELPGFLASGEQTALRPRVCPAAAAAEGSWL